MITSNQVHHKCPECGFIWEHGKDGTHSCVRRLREIADKQCSALLATQCHCTVTPVLKELPSDRKIFICIRCRAVTEWLEVIKPL